MPSSEHSDAAKSKAARGVKKRSTPVQAERRRAQNRISQQCLREKNLAYVRHLENVTQALQASKDASNNDRYSMLLEVHLKVVDENRRLEEALFRLRKKLLSLSNSASSAAEDPIFDSLLGRENKPPEGDESLTPPFEFSPESPLPLAVTGNQNNSPPPPVDQAAAQGGPAAYTGGLLDPEFNQCMHQNGGVTGLEDLLSGNNALSFENITSVQLIPMPRPLQSQDRLYITCTTTFGNGILNACKEWLKRSSSSEPMQYPEPHEKQIKDISRAATHFLASRCGLESYIYGVNGAVHIEKLFGWRLGATNHRMIPKPFRPTPLQARRPQHLMGIDLFNWPEIRDQLVLEEPRLDIDSLMRDLTIHSVIEQPQHGVAVGVYDLFQNHILPRAKDVTSAPEHHPHHHQQADKSWLFDRSWVLYDVDVKSHRFRGLTSDPVLEAMVEELDRRVQTLRSGEAGADLGPDWPRGDKFQRNEIALFFGLDNMSTWKLSKEFAEKYPFLDCSSATSQYKTVPAASVFGRL